MMASVYGQSISHDSTYYQSFPGKLTGRYYFSQKFTGVDVIDKLNEIPDLIYRPNTSLNMGVGASYKAINLNLAFSFGFLNKGRGREVDTKYLDLQFHTFPDRWALDGYFQFYQGFQLVPKGKFAGDGEDYYKRRDIKIREIGASANYVFNGGKFSYKAAFFQSEWQKKSAGTPLVGFEAYGGTVKGDSSLIPKVAGELSDREFNRVSFFELGPNLGYAYTLVIAKHFFLMGSATGNLGFGFTQSRGNSKEINWAVNANYLLKASVGFNFERWAINANYVYNNVRLAKIKDFSNGVVTGNYRLNFIYRFDLGQKGKRILDEMSPR